MTQNRRPGAIIQQFAARLHKRRHAAREKLRLLTLAQLYERKTFLHATVKRETGFGFSLNPNAACWSSDLDPDGDLVFEIKQLYAEISRRAKLDRENAVNEPLSLITLSALKREKAMHERALADIERELIRRGLSGKKKDRK